MTTRLNNLFVRIKTLSRFFQVAIAVSDWKSRANLLVILKGVLSGHRTVQDPVRVTLSRENIKGSIFINSITDVAVLWEVFVNKEYELYLENSDVENIRVIVDLGSNIGASVLYFLLRYPQAHIYAVEADPVVFKRLRQNVGANKRVTLVNAAVGSNNGEAIFYQNDSHLSGSVLQRKNTSTSISIPMVTLDSLLSKYSISLVDILKFDIEGSEHETIKSFKNLQKVSIITGEAHFDLMPYGREEFVGLFEGFSCLEKPLGEFRSLYTFKLTDEQK